MHGASQNQHRRHEGTVTLCYGVLGTVGVQQRPWALPTRYHVIPTGRDNQKCFQTQTNVSWDSPHCCKMWSQFHHKESAVCAPGGGMVGLVTS